MTIHEELGNTHSLAYKLRIGNSKIIWKMARQAQHADNWMLATAYRTFQENSYKIGSNLNFKAQYRLVALADFTHPEKSE